MTSAKGKARAAIAATGMRVSPHMTNRFRPKGGVMKPRPRVVIMKTQKWIWFMPTALGQRPQQRTEDEDVRARSP